MPQGFVNISVPCTFLAGGTQSFTIYLMVLEVETALGDVGGQNEQDIQERYSEKGRKNGVLTQTMLREKLGRCFLWDEG